MAQQGALCTQLHPPTAVTHCAAAWLSRPPQQAGPGTGTGGAGTRSSTGLPDLVVVRSTQLEVFSLRAAVGGADAQAAPSRQAGTAGAGGSGGGKGGAASLELLSSCQLFGVVESLAVLRSRAPGQRDAILLTFRDAKLSVLRWDPGRHELAPSSLHSFEGDASFKQGRVSFPYPPMAVTDPAGRCGAVVMLRHQLAVLPAVDSELLALGISGADVGGTLDEDAEVEELLLGGKEGGARAGAAAGGGASGEGAGGGGAAGSGAAAVGNSYVDNLGKTGIKQVRDAAFLHGYSEPVLVLLHETEPTWAGNLRQKHDTCALSALSLNLTRKNNPKIWGASELPSDASRLSAAPCGGVLVLCQHLVLYYRQGQQAGVVLHPSALPPAAPPPPLVFDAAAMQEAGGPGPAAAKYASEHAMDVYPETVPAAVAFCDTSQAAELKATADGASVCWLARDSALLCLRSGQLLQLAVQQVPGGGGARRLAVGRAGAAPQPSCCCSLVGEGAFEGDAGSVVGQEPAQPALVFFGSAAGDSLLVSATPAAKPGAAEAGLAGSKRPAEAAAGGAATAGGSGDFGRQESKRMRLESMEEAGAGEAAAGEQQAAAGQAAGQETGQQQQQEAQPAAADYDSEDEEAMIYGTALIAPAAPAAAAASTTAGAGPTAAAGAGAGPLAAAAQELPRYQLKVLDSLANIGPVRDFAVVESGAALGGAPGEAPPCLVACSGEGKGGTLSVLRRSVVPDVITEVPLPGLLGAWAVHHHPADAPVPTPGQPLYHSYLLLSFPGATKVLATGEELREVTEMVEFAIDTPTLAAGGLCGGRRIAQVFPQGVRLMDGEESVQEVWASELAASAGGTGTGAGGSVTIVAADVLDPCVSLLLSDGSAAVLAADSSTLRLAPVPAAGDGPAAAAAAEALRPSQQQDQLTACSLYRDSCGWLGRQLGPAAAAANGMYCLLCRASGACQLYSLPAWQVAFDCADLAGSPALLAGMLRPSAGGQEEPVPAVVEARLVSFGPAGSGRSDAAAGRASQAPACEPPLLVALTADHHLLAYRAFGLGGPGRSGSRAAEAGGTASRRLRFRRLPLDVPLLLPPAAGVQPAGTPWRLQRLHCFEGMGEDAPYSGLFVAGQHPQWLVAARGTLLPHPHHLPPPAGQPHAVAAAGAAAVGAAGFTAFHNVNCPFGFILATCGARSGIQIAQLPPRTRLDAPWPRQRVAVKGTPLKVAHYAEADLFAVLTCRQVPFKPFLPEEEEPGEPQASYSYALAEAAAKARGTMQGHELRLLWPGGGWQGVWRHELLPGEKALSVAAVRLKDQATGATVPLLAVGAALPAGEDYPCGGRLLLIEVTRGGASAGASFGAGATDGPGQWGGRLIYTREFRGPVTALAALEGYLLLASGNRIETCALSSTTVTSTGEDGTITAATTWRLQRSSFYDGPMLLTSLNVVKNFVLLGDVAHSVQFVRYKEEGRQLSLLSKDFNRAAVAATQFLINGSSLHLAMGDAAGTLRLLSYLPSHPESWKGQRLVAWGAYHFGDAASAMQRLRLHPPGPEDRTTRQAVLLSTATGALALLAPLALPAAAGLEPGAALAALRALQRELALLLPQAAGLNPAAFRRRHALIPLGLQGGRCFSRPLALEEQGVLDGDLLRQYQVLPRRQQEAAAEAAGLDREQLGEVLQGLWRAGGTLL